MTIRFAGRSRPLAALGLGIALGSTCVYLSAQGAAGVGGPSTRTYTGTIDFGDRHYEQEFSTNYTFENNCDSGVVVNFDSRGVPFLSVMPRVDGPPGTTEIAMTLTTPGWPERPQCTDLRGSLIVTSSGYENDAGVCYPSERTYTVTAHVHWWDRPPPPPKLKAAGPSNCVVWWNTGQPPTGSQSATEEACVDTIRALADAYREWVLQAANGQPPDQWSWLPSNAQIMSMSISQLLSMRDRASKQLGVTP